MLEVDEGIPIPETERQLRLNLAKSIFSNGNVGKSTAAKMALDELGLWQMVQRQSAIDYLRSNLTEK